MTEYQNLYVGGETYQTTLTPKYEGRKAHTGANPREVRAVIPGTILHISVREEQEVERGDVLLLLEAMKMKNPVQATRPGRIKTVHVKTGDVVPKGALLVEYEA